MQVPRTAHAFEAFARREMVVERCKDLEVKHACALLLDTRTRTGYLVESQLLLPFVRRRVEELVEGTLGMRLHVHRLTTQYESTARGEFRFKWCLMYLHAMAIALAESLLSPPVTPPHRTERAYLEAVWRLMHALMRRRVRQVHAAGSTDDLVSRLVSLLADAEVE